MGQSAEQFSRERQKANRAFLHALVSTRTFFGRFVFVGSRTVPSELVYTQGTVRFVRFASMSLHVALDAAHLEISEKERPFRIC